MFGQNTFGSTPSGGFGTNTNTFGTAAAAPNVFGAQPAKPTFGAFGAPQPAAGGGMFGTTSQPGGMFGATAAAPATNTFGGGAFGQPAANTSFGATSAFKPAGTGGFGATTTTQSTGGMFGSSFGTPAQATVQPVAGGLFGAAQQATNQFGGATGAFGAAAPATGGFGAALPAFGQQQAGAVGAPGTGHVKFNPLTGSDTMMKQGVQSQISKIGRASCRERV